MRIVVSSVFVDDQDKALDFYTNKLGFVKKTEIPMGAARWLTVVAPSDPDGTELLAPPDDNDPAEETERAAIEARVAGSSDALAMLPAAGLDLREHLLDIERRLVMQALERSDGVVAHAARLLNLRRTTLVEKLKRLGKQSLM